jgi:hypothetical protein
MTTLTSRTRVRSVEGGGLTAHCFDCGVELLLAAGADVADALAALDAAHPAREHRRRTHGAPRGWLVPAPISGSDRPYRRQGRDA